MLVPQSGCRVVRVCVGSTEWSREMLLEAWMDDAIACCDKCGVQPPVSVLEEEALSASGCQGDTVDNELLTPVASISSQLGDREVSIKTWENITQKLKMLVI